MEVYVSQYRKMTNEIRLEILKLWNEGKSGSEIAKLLGITRNSVIGVSYRARKNGLISLIKPRKEKTKKKTKKIQFLILVIYVKKERPNI